MTQATLTREVFFHLLGGRLACLGRHGERQSVPGGLSTLPLQQAHTRSCRQADRRRRWGLKKRKAAGSPCRGAAALPGRVVARRNRTFRRVWPPVVLGITVVTCSARP